MFCSFSKYLFISSNMLSMLKLKSGFGISRGMVAFCILVKLKSGMSGKRPGVSGFSPWSGTFLRYLVLSVAGIAVETFLTKRKMHVSSQVEIYFPFFERIQYSQIRFARSHNFVRRRTSTHGDSPTAILHP